uniref:AN1-type domain-containing protein n=1 Tax=Oryza barthii TaxID=65489 RepID=A0A0D3FQ20_9ORYZ
MGVQLVFLTMAQESWKKEAEETGVHTPEAPILCVNNCGFFGSRMTENMCSKCYRDTVKAKTVATVVEKKPLASLSSTPSVAEVTDGGSGSVADGKQVMEEDTPKPPSNRCLSCRKKVGLTGFKCRCGGTFCSMHRYADSHKCTFDYKQAGREQIAKQNPLVKADKITKI